jgi:predicted HAD superfamily hydrolase
MNEFLSSFDVFDTVLVRRVGEPTGVFLLLAQRLRQLSLLDLSGADFQSHRIGAERRATQRVSGKGGPKIQEIYRELAQSLGWSAEQSHTAMLEELEVEKMILFAVPDAQLRILQARQNQSKVVFLSDMYWSSTEIKSLLLCHSAARQEDLVFSSADIGQGKASGELFRHVLRSMNGCSDTIVHLGNSLEADVAGAKRAGVRGEYFGSGNLSAREKILLRDPSNIFEQHLSGTARICRLKHFARDGSWRIDALSGIVSSVIMPVLLSFALWVAREANKRHLERLVFVSRDGWLLKKAVEKALRISGQHVECIFIYGSRQAWHGAAVRPDRVESCTWLFEGRDKLTMQRLLRRLGISGADQQKIANGLNISLEESEALTEDQLQKVLSWLRDLKEENSDLLAALRRKRHAVVSYLRQEGVISDRSTAIVDLGWAGRLQDSLNILIEQEGGRLVEGLFLGLVESAKATRHQKIAFLFDHRGAFRRLENLAGLLQVLESFCTQRHGSVLDYQQDDDGRWSPVFSTKEDQALVDWGIDHVHSVCETYLIEFPDDCETTEESSEQLAGRAQRIIREFVNNPSEMEARVWGAFPFEHEQSGGNPIALATPFPGPWGAFKRAIGDQDERPMGGYWRSAAKIMTPWWKQIFARTISRSVKLLKRASLK